MKYCKNLDTNIILYADSNEVELLFQDVQRIKMKDDLIYECIFCLVK